MKGGRFHVRLLSPALPEQVEQYRGELDQVADEWEYWPAASSEDRSRLVKARYVLSALPLSVAVDRNAAARVCVATALARKPAVVVADFVHSAALLPDAVAPVPSVLFTHNCEAEVYERLAAQARNPVTRHVWRSQAAKMQRFETASLRRFDVVLAVAERDAERFAASYGRRGVITIPTGVDLDYFPFVLPKGERRVVFTGGMDWPANIDGIEWMMSEVWPTVRAQIPNARMSIIGKKPPAHLVRRAAGLPGWEFTGRVPDVRPLMAGADAFAIPLRIGSGTRIKAYEAMAAGVPVVSTTIGVEGLQVEQDRHYLRADAATDFAGTGAALSDRGEGMRWQPLPAGTSRHARHISRLNCLNGYVDGGNSTRRCGRRVPADFRAVKRRPHERA
jgi:glycosyltransferase involved in cell wall biosynthesis